MLCVCSAFESYQGVCLKVRFVDRVFQFFRSLCFISWICSVLKEVFRTFPLHFLLMSFFCIFFLKLCVCVCVCVCVIGAHRETHPLTFQVCGGLLLATGAALGSRSAEPVHPASPAPWSCSQPSSPTGHHCPVSGVMNFTGLDPSSACSHSRSICLSEGSSFPLACHPQGPSVWVHIAEFPSLLGWRVFCGAYRPHFLCPLSCRWAVGCFHVLSVVDCAAVNMGELRSLQDSDFSYFGDLSFYRCRYRYRYMLCLLSHVRLFVTLWTVACKAPLSVGFSRQEHWSGLSALLQGIFPT